MADNQDELYNNGSNVDSCGDLQPRKQYKMGWVRDLPDYRDRLYSASLEKLESPTSLPPRVDLRGLFPVVYDQGNLGSCTANAIGGAFQYNQIKKKYQNWVPSRLFVYYNERAMEGTINSDSGAQIRDGVKSVSATGVIPETMWPYDIQRFMQKPPAQTYIEAQKHKASQYYRLDNTNINQLRNCLAAGYPWVFGVIIYNTFMSSMDGYIPMPTPYDQPQGGHAILGVGYDDQAQVFIFRNSWGTTWGENGYGYIPYHYVTNPYLASDFWTIRDVTGDAFCSRK